MLYKYGKGYKVPVDLIKDLGYTVEHIEHVMTQIPALVEESIKRIKYAPFDADSMFTNCATSNASIVRFLADSIDYIPSKSKNIYNPTQIDGMTMYSGGTVIVRGQEVDCANMPLYLEDGLDNLQYIYPIFDWTPLQIWAALFLYDLSYYGHL